MQELHLQERQKRNTPKIKDCFSIHWEKPLLIFIRCCKKQNIKTSGGVNVLSDISCKLHSTMGKKRQNKPRIKPYREKECIFFCHYSLCLLVNWSLWWLEIAVCDTIYLYSSEYFSFHSPLYIKNATLNHFLLL